MGRKKQEEVESEYETDSGSEFDEDEYETDEEEVAAAAALREPKKAGHKAEEPCKTYRVDTTAAAFGTCKCGWPKVDHDGKKANKAAEALNRLKSSRSPAADAGGSGDGPCHNFRVDVTADKFGKCKCGYMQHDHGAKKINPAREALMSLRAPKSKSEEHVARGGRACQNYSVDPKASEFGTCYCGFKKADHVKKDEDPAAMMLRKLKEKNQAANEQADMLAAGITHDPEFDREEPSDTSKKDKKGSSDEADPGPRPAKPAKSGGGCCVVM